MDIFQRCLHPASSREENVRNNNPEIAVNYPGTSMSTVEMNTAAHLEEDN